MNNVSLVGNIVRDIDYRENEKTKVSKFSIAITRYTGSEEKKVDYPNIVAFGGTAEILNKYCGKGSKVGITGSIQTESYTNKDGKKVFVTEVVATRIELLGTKKSEEPKEVPMPSTSIKEEDLVIDDSFLPF